MIDGNVVFQYAIISSQKNFYRNLKMLEWQKVPRQNIIDGRVFQVPNFSFGRFMETGIAYGVIDTNNFSASSFTIHPQIFATSANNAMITFGTKSYIDVSASILGGVGVVNIENYSSLAANVSFNLMGSEDHDYRRVSTLALCHSDFAVTPDFYENYSNKPSKHIKVGNDVWVGRGSSLKSTNPDKPLTIGDGAVIASDSVVVKDVPPYAIVGGNPAKIIKYRFPEKIIESLLRIKWWDWDIDKIHDNFKYFNRVEEFVEMHDKGV